MKTALPWRPVKITLTVVLLTIAVLALIDHKIAAAMEYEFAAVHFKWPCMMG